MARRLSREVGACGRLSLHHGDVVCRSCHLRRTVVGDLVLSFTVAAKQVELHGL
jgi:hypothetical protein